MMNEDTCESWLIEQGQRGNRQALQALVMRWNQPVLALAHRLLRHEADAEDARQLTLVRLVQNLDRFEGRSQFSTWVYRIAVNVCRDFQRRREAQRRTPNADVSPNSPRRCRTLLNRAGGDQEDGLAVDGERTIEHEEQRGCLTSALSRLDHDSLEILILRHYHDRTFADIGAIVNMPESTVRHRMARALETLRRDLEPLLIGPSQE